MLKMIDEMVAVLAEAKAEAEKFVAKGNSSAGTRVRKAMLELKKKAQEVREAVSDVKHAE